MPSIYEDHFEIKKAKRRGQNQVIERRVHYETEEIDDAEGADSRLL